MADYIFGPNILSGSYTFGPMIRDAGAAASGELVATQATLHGAGAVRVPLHAASGALLASNATISGSAAKSILLITTSRVITLTRNKTITIYPR